MTGLVAVTLPALVAAANGTGPVTGSATLTLPKTGVAAAGTVSGGAPVLLTYGDPELLVANWIVATLDIPARADPDMRADYWADAPVAHVQRGQGFGTAPLSLDDVTLDIDVFGARADHVRDAAHRIWMAMLMQLPLTTFGNGIFVKHVSAISAPVWSPDPSAKRRSAAYRVILHGVVSQPPSP